MNFRILNIFMFLTIIKISPQNATISNISQEQQNDVPETSFAPPLSMKFPYTPSRKSILEELIGEPLVPGPALKSLPPKNMSLVPNEFLSNFNDFAHVHRHQHEKGSGYVSTISNSTQEHFSNRKINITAMAFANLAAATHTHSECYTIQPMNFTNITALMGDWYISTYRYGKVKGMRRTAERVTCENIRYTQTGENTFTKNANVYFQKKWMSIRGSGRLIAPGIILIYWKQLHEPARDTQLTYNILCTNYKTWVIGYTCTIKSKQPQLVLQTSSPRPSKETINEANQCIKGNSFKVERHLVNHICAMDY